MTLWGRNLTNGQRFGIYNAAGIRFYRQGDRMRMWTTVYTDLDSATNQLFFPTFKAEKKTFRYGIKWTKSRLLYYADGKLIRAFDTNTLSSDFVGPLHIDFAVFSQKNGSLPGPDYRYEKKSEFRVQKVKYTPGESCTMS